MLNASNLLQKYCYNILGRKGIDRFSSKINDINEEDVYNPKRYGDMNIHRLVNSLGSELMEEQKSVTSNASKPKGVRPLLIKRTMVPDGSHIYKKLGDTLKLECHVDGMPPPTIVWYKVTFCEFLLGKCDCK